jgi:hypothetical protein
MSYYPSDNIASNAMQLFTSGATLSADITTNNDTQFLSNRFIYFIDIRHLYNVNSSVTGLNVWRHLSTGTKFGGTFRCNAVSSLTMMTDESYCAANVINSMMTTTVSTSGSGVVANNFIFKAIWRIK